MKLYNYSRLIIPGIVMVTGIFNLLNPSLDPSMKTFWWFLTPFALAVGVLRVYLLYRQNKNQATDQ